LLDTNAPTDRKARFIGPRKGGFVLPRRSISEMQRVRYLLGLSSPAECEHIESDYFDNEDAFQEMLTAEDDLIDSYARGELAGEEVRRFEKTFVSSLRVRDRVQFARAFAGTVSAPRPVESELPGFSLLHIFKTFQLPGLLKTATIASMIVFVALLAWLVIDRRRLTNELRELRAESAELSKRTEALQRSSDTERTRTAEIAAQLADLRAQTDRPGQRERGTTAAQQTRHSPEVIATKPEQAEKPINHEDALLGARFVNKKVTQLPLEAKNFEDLLTLTPGISTGFVNGGRTDQSNVTLDGVDVNIPIPRFLSWIRFQIPLETAATHENYRVTIKTADGRFVTSVDWVEPLTPNQTIIDTPVISTVDLPSGDYVLLLMGKEIDGSFVEVAERSFKVIKHETPQAK
jgi:hypothetical protein